MIVVTPVSRSLQLSVDFLKLWIMTCEDFLYLCSPAFFILFSFLQLLNLLLKIPAEAHLQVSIFAISSSLTQTKLDGHSHCATFYSEQWQTEKVLVNLFEIVIIFAILFGANNGINTNYTQI